MLIVVDSVLEKAHTDANELICTHWDHSQQRYVKGLKFVSLRYQAGELAPPIAVELMRKTVPVYQPKTQKRVISARSPRMSTCSRYCAWRSHRWPTATCWPIAGTPRPRIRPWCGPWATPFFALESSRPVALSAADRAQGQFQSVQSLVFADTQPVRVYLRSVQEAVLVTRQVFTNQDGSQGILYLVSSDTDLDQAQMTTIYQRR